MAANASGDGYTVTPADLTGHASTVDQLGSTLGQAVAAAQQVSVGVAAYGMIAGPLFIPIVTAISSAGIDALNQAQTSMASVSTAMQSTVANYTAIEQSTADAFNAIQTPGATS